MSYWLIGYAAVVTLAAIVCAVGWRFAHSTLIALIDVEADDWPSVRNLLRQTLGKLKS